MQIQELHFYLLTPPLFMLTIQLLTHVLMESATSQEWRLLFLPMLCDVMLFRNVASGRHLGGRLVQCFEITMFPNQESDATFQNILPGAIFCDYASELYHEWHTIGARY